jgi:hypothetical protein
MIFTHPGSRIPDLRSRIQKNLFRSRIRKTGFKGGQVWDFRSLRFTFFLHHACFKGNALVKIILSTPKCQEGWPLRRRPPRPRWPPRARLHSRRLPWQFSRRPSRRHPWRLQAGLLRLSICLQFSYLNPKVALASRLYGVKIRKFRAMEYLTFGHL